MQSYAGMTQPCAGFQCCLPIRDSSCENDLEELMRQIDIMVNSKKVEWEQQVVTLQQRLQAQDKELSDARNALDKKKCEIQLLWKKLEESDQAEHEKVEKYEKQLQTLRYQLCKLKKSYEKLSFYSSKNQSDKNGELCPEDKTSQCELQWLTHRLEEFKVLSNEWENQRAFYKNQLKSLCDQRKSLTEKCQLLQEQSQSYQEQLSSRTQLQDEAIANNQAEIRRLRCQLDVSQETIRSDRVIIDNLNSTIKEITLSRNSLKDENQQLLEELNRCQKRCQKMELDLSEVRAALQAHNHLLESGELDQKPVQIAGPDVTLNKKPHGNDTSIQEQCEPRTYKAQSQDLAMKRFGLCKPLHDQIENDQEEKAESTSLERLRTDITEPTTKLHQRDIPTATTSDKHFHLEQDLELQEHNNGIQQALKSPKELREDAAADSGILHPEFERPNERHIKPHAEQEMKEQLPGKMKVSQRLRAKAATQINGDQERSFVEKSNYKATKQAAHYSNGNPTFQSEWELNHCDWDSPSRSLRINLDTLQAINNLQNGDHSWDFMDFSPPFFWDPQKDTFTSSSTGTSFISAAEKFLNEENKRAKDFEDVLNLHIEEMQRYSENTLAKYRILYQSRHI